MAEKDFKSIAEQRALLTSRGLTIEDNSAAEEFLLHNNYYRISGYSLTLPDPAKKRQVLSIRNDAKHHGHLQPRSCAATSFTGIH